MWDTAQKHHLEQQEASLMSHICQRSGGKTKENGGCMEKSMMAAIVPSQVRVFKPDSVNTEYIFIFWNKSCSPEGRTLIL